MWVEKIDLKSLFTGVCEMFHVPITNVKGWNDINGRAEAMLRFKEWESAAIVVHCSIAATMIPAVGHFRADHVQS